MYSLAQKECFKFSNEKFLVFFVVNIFEILHASTYGLYKYTCKVKKPAADTMRPPGAARRGRSERHSRALVQKEGRSKEGRKATKAKA